MRKKKIQVKRVRTKYGDSLNYAKFLLSQRLPPKEVKNLVELAFPELKNK